MREYGLPPTETYNLLKEKGIGQLFHANTLKTSLTFIEQKALLSRHYIESNDLLQSRQKSDEE